MLNKLLHILFFVLGVATGYFAWYYLQEPCPEHTGHWETVFTDTTRKVNTGGGTVPAVGFHHNEKVSSKNYYVRFDSTASTVVQDINIESEVISEQEPSRSDWYGEFRDSLTKVNVIAYVTGEGCNVDSFQINYATDCFEITNTERLIPELPGQKRASSVFLFLQPTTNGTRNGLSVGLARLKSRYLYGLQYDPLIKQAGITMGIKLW